MTFQGSKMSNAPENDSFVPSFIHWGLRTESKGDYMNVRQTKARKAL